MKNCFIFSYNENVPTSNEMYMQNHLVLFFPYKNVKESFSDIQKQLREYFHQNTLPDQLFIICFEFNKEEIRIAFEEKSEIYNYIPKFVYDQNEDSIHIVSLNKTGHFEAIMGNCPDPVKMKSIYQRGMVKIFRDNGGLIIAQPNAHHFVFPSGKHSNKFLRTGNVLIHGEEILFIASALVFHFKKESFESIYTDTSSINSLVYAYINLLKELNPNFTESVRVESFGSYKMFEKHKFQAKRGTLFLISSSTSGSILRRMTETRNKASNIELTNIAIIYGLGVESAFSQQIICDLSFNNENNPKGLEEFESYNVSKGQKCLFCFKGSKTLKIEGDVFLLEKPIVTSHLIYKKDHPSYLKTISDFFKKQNKDSEPLIRCFHKEYAYDDKKYDIYIDIDHLLGQWEDRNLKSHPYQSIFIKLEKYILQNIPASLKYMVHLPDEGSKNLSLIIAKTLNEHGINFDVNNILSTESSDLKRINTGSKGVIAIISSSIVTGGNLLYLSRYLRDFEKTYQRIFFTFINRTSTPAHFDFLQSNIGQGEFGKFTHKVFDVEVIHCSQKAQNTTWHIEEDQIKKLQEFFDDHEDFKKIIQYCTNRIVVLAECGKDKGLSNNLFFPTLKDEILKIRNGFAFAPFQSGQAHTDFISRAKQSEVYFIISSILNDMRIKGTFDQSEYVRNIIDPGNFVRYNDGIIQACFLRAATDDELDYSLSEEMDLKMKSILGDMILHLADDHAEALNEFFYAISIRKLKLLPSTITDCISLLKKQEYYKNNDSILKGLVKFIEEKVLVDEEIDEKFKQLSQTLNVDLVL